MNTVAIDLWDIPLEDDEGRCHQCGTVYQVRSIKDAGLCQPCISDEASRYMTHYEDSIRNGKITFQNYPKTTHSQGSGSAAKDDKFTERGLKRNEFHDE